jgi:hypothetical protein
MCNRGLELSVDLEPVGNWRIDRLRDAGFPVGLAYTVVHDTRYDVHSLLELTDRGLPRRAGSPDPGSTEGRVGAVLITPQRLPAGGTAESCSASVGRRSMASSKNSVAGARSEQESRVWLERLGTTGVERDAALAELHALLLRAARFEVNRRRAMSPHLRGGDDDDLTHQSADDALVMNVNVWDVNEHVQALISSRQPIDLLALGDRDTPLDSLVGEPQTQAD